MGRFLMYFSEILLCSVWLTPSMSGGLPKRISIVSGILLLFNNLINGNLIGRVFWQCINKCSTVSSTRHVGQRGEAICPILNRYALVNICPVLNLVNLTASWRPWILLRVPLLVTFGNSAWYPAPADLADSSQAICHSSICDFLVKLIKLTQLMFW